MPVSMFPPVTFETIGRDELNACLVAWGHRMGPVRRPTGGWSHGLRYGDELVAVAATDVLMQPRVAGLGRHEALELSRLCASRPDLCRAALRLSRVFVFPVLAAERGYRWRSAIRMRPFIPTISIDSTAGAGLAVPEAARTIVAAGRVAQSSSGDGAITNPSEIGPRLN